MNVAKQARQDCEAKGRNPIRQRRRNRDIFLWSVTLMASLACLAGHAGALGPTLVVCDDVADPLSLNPLKEFDVRSDNIVFQMFEGLVRFSDDGQLEPCLATSWKRIDPLTMEFKLREGVTFHNGEPFNAASVKFSIDILLDPATKAPCFPQISTIDRVDMVDAFTVRILTKVPDGMLLYRLPAFVKVLPSKYYAEVGEEGFDQHPVGTGPFKFVEWKKGRQIVLAAHHAYWEQGLPKIGTVVFKFVPSDLQVPGLLKGELDLVTELPGTFTREVMENKKTKVVKRACWAFPGFLFCERGPLKHYKVRAALNHAIDRKALIRYLAYGNGVPMAACSMKGQCGHDERLEPYTLDIPRALALMKEAGFPKGFTLKMIVSEEAAREARAIAAQLKKINVETELKIAPMSEVVQAWANPEKGWDCYGTLGTDPMGHVAFTYGIGMYSKSPFSGYRDDTFDGIFERMIANMDAIAHERLAKEMDAYVYGHAMALFTYQRMKVYGIKASVEVTPHPSGSLYLRTASLGVSAP